MPRVAYNGKKFIVRWPEEAKKRLFEIAEKYVKNYTYHKNGRKKQRKIVSWKRAYKEGALKGLPNVSLKQMSRYYSLLRLDSEERREKRRIKARNKKSKHNQDRYGLFKDSPGRKTFKQREIWSKKQKNLLIRLANMKKHRKGQSINWGLLMKHPWIKKLPGHYHNNLNGLRKYYWNVARKDRNDPEYVRAHRKGALDWKHKNHRRYLKNQYRRQKVIRKSINEMLLEKLGTI